MPTITTQAAKHENIQMRPENSRGLVLWRYRGLWIRILANARVTGCHILWRSKPVTIRQTL